MGITTVYRIHDPPSAEVDAVPAVRLSLRRTERLHQRNFRGHAKVGWLDSRHTVSPSNFRDSDRQ